MELLKKEYISVAAYIAAASIWSVSFYTNLIGARWIFGEQDRFPWASLLFALAISICLLIVALNFVTCLRKGRGILRAVLIYLCVFTLSSAFTYQALFLRFSIQGENEEARLSIAKTI